MRALIGEFRLLITRGDRVKGEVIRAVEFKDLGPITTSRGLVDVLLEDGKVIELVDPTRHLRRLGRSRSPKRAA